MINEHPPKMTKENEQMWKETHLMNKYTSETKVESVLRFNNPEPKKNSYLGKIS